MGSSFAEYRDRYVRFVGGYAEYGLPVMRIGLGAVILLAGAHKLIAPQVWTRYASPVVTGLWPEAVVPFESVMVLNGVVEVSFGLAILLGFYPAITAGIVALSLLGVVIDLSIGAILTGKFVDVLIRDVGLLALATGVTVRSAGVTPEE